MNRKQFFLSIILLVVLCAGGFFFMKRSSASWNKGASVPGETLLRDFDVNKVVQMSLRGGGVAVTLKRAADVWVVADKHNYPADFVKISDFVKKLHEMKVVQNIKAGKSQLGRLGLDPADLGKEDSVRLELIAENDVRLSSLLLGKKHQKKESENASSFGNGSWPDGRYILVEGAGAPKLVADSLDEAVADPLAWHDKAFYEIDKIKAVEVLKTDGADSWKITKESESADFSLAEAKEGEEFDKSKIYLSSFLKYVSFKDLKPEQADFKFSENAAIETFDGFKYELKADAKDGETDKYWISIKVSCAIPEKREAKADEKPEDKEKLDKEFSEKTGKLKEKFEKDKKLSVWLYLVGKGDIESILKSRKDLLKPKEEKKEEPLPQPPPEKQ